MEQAPVDPLLIWLLHFLALLQKKHFLPDAALNLLLHFLYIFFKVLYRLSPHDQLARIVHDFPPTTYKFHKLLYAQNKQFLKYVVCQRCSTVYKFEDCTEKIGSREVARICKNRFSNQERPCNGELVRRVELINKNIIFYPNRVYCYMPLCRYLANLVNRPGFDALCNQWKTNISNDGVYKDVYDGKIWKEFQTYKGQPFLSEPFTYGLMLNIDWFKPFKHTEYSLGAIYLTIMNLHRTVRFRQENVILVGLIPGPSEPKRDINAFLTPLVEELQRLFVGVDMFIHTLSKNFLVRCALLCIACDIPASRKVCGFLGHSANLGCSKCLKMFPGSVGKKDYSGFERHLWKQRCLEEHTKNIHEIRQCKTKTARNTLESKYGCRYSKFLDLCYFDPIRMTIIDPMHNLYLGSAKLVLKRIWIEQGLLSSKSLDVVQDRIDSILSPPYLGKIPHKIASSCSGFTADQFKNWTNIFSMMVVRDILPAEHLKCWGYFVQASRILCQMILTDAEIELADAFLLQFCRRAESLYGKNMITPNMHLHCHLKQSLLDYGPIHNFWLFSFERYNGILEHFPSNNRSIEIQLMQRFIREFELSSSCHNLPMDYQTDFSSLFDNNIEPVLQGSLQVTIHGKFISRFDPRNVTDWTLAAYSKNIDIAFPKSYFRSTLTPSELTELNQVYAYLYSTVILENDSLNSVCKKYCSVLCNRVRYKAGSLVYATNMSNTIPHPTDQYSIVLKPQPVLIKYFIIHSYQYQGTIYMHLFAVVSWLKEHHARYFHIKPFELWWKDLYDVTLFEFVPIQLLLCHSVHTDVKFEGQTVYLTCPVQNIPKLGV